MNRWKHLFYSFGFTKECNVTASCYRSLNALTEVEDPEEIGKSLWTGTHRHRSILPPRVKDVPWVETSPSFFQFQGDMGIVSTYAKTSSRASKHS